MVNKHYTYKGLLLICFLLSGLVAAAQQSGLAFNLMTTEERAAHLFNQRSYAEAIPYLKEIQKQSPQHIGKQLAYAYYQTKDYKQAKRYFSQLENIDALEVAYILAYAQSLQHLQLIAEAKQIYQLYLNKTGSAQTVPADLGKKEFNQHARRYSVQNVTLNSKYNDFSPFKIKDKLYFSSDMPVSLLTKEELSQHAFNVNLYEASSLSAVRFSQPELINEISSPHHEGNLCADTLGNIYFTQFKSNEKYVLYTGRYENGKFRSVSQLRLPFKGNIIHIATNAAGNTMVFSSDMEGGKGGLDLYISHKSGSSWSAPEPLGTSINTPGNEAFPAIYDNKLYYASDGKLGLGGLDIFQAYGSGNSFEGSYNIGAPINSSADDFGLIPDKEGGYFVSARKGGRGGDDIYRFVYHTITLKGLLTDSTNNRPVEGVKVVLLGAEGQQETQTNKYGEYEFSLHPGEEYKISFEPLSDFKPRAILYNTYTGQAYGKREISTALERKTKLYVLGRVRLENKKRTSEPHIIVYDKTAGYASTVNGNKRGGFEAELDKDSQYAFMATCGGLGGIAYFETPESYDASLSYYVNLYIEPYRLYNVNISIAGTTNNAPLVLQLINQTTGENSWLFAEKGKLSFEANSLCSYQLCVQQGSSTASYHIPVGIPPQNLEIELSLSAKQ